jgi:hypothetical protein
MQSWIANRQFFFINPGQQAFFGTQLVLISRQFTTIAETVNEVRFALDSVFIGPSERQTLLLRFADIALAPMFLEDVLGEVERFFGDEASRLLRDGGKISVTNNILPVVQSLQHMVDQAHAPLNIDELPDGFKTARVRNALDDLQDQLAALVELIEQVEQKVPPAEDKLVISSMSTPHQTSSENPVWRFSIYGNEFDPAAVVNIYSSIASGIPTHVTFYSAQRIDVRVDDYSWSTLTLGNHDVTVTSNGQSATLFNAFIINDNGTARVNAYAAPKRGKVRKVTVGTSRLVRTVPATPPPAARPVPDQNTTALNKLQKSYDELAQKFDRAMNMVEAKAKDNKSRHKND